MRLVSSDEVSLAVHDLGGAGPALVLAHATGFHGRVWDALVPTLAPHFRCWSFDARGQGRSTRPQARPQGDPFDWGGFGDDVLAVVEDLDADEVYGFGHSQGASALLLAEQARSGTFAGLYLYEAVAWPEARLMDDHPLVVGAERRRRRFESVEAAKDRLGARPPLCELDPRVLAAYVEHGLEPSSGGGVQLRCDPADEAQIYRQGVRHSAFARLVEVACPVTLARGTASEAVSAGLARRQAELLPRGHLEEFDGLGHLGPLQEPERVAAAAVAALLSGV